MSYTSINRCANDSSFTGRVTAACAAEGRNPPEEAMLSVRWPVASASDVEAAYESALAAGNEDPGGDPAVVTDGMILSAVQANLPPETT